MIYDADGFTLCTLLHTSGPEINNIKNLAFNRAIAVPFKLKSRVVAVYVS